MCKLSKIIMNTAMFIISYDILYNKKIKGISILSKTKFY